MMLPLYGLISDLATPLLRRLLLRRAAAGKENPQRMPERFGMASHPRPPGALIWLHAASVGESLSLLPLLDRLLAHFPDMQALVTTGTVTSARLMAARLPPRAIHQFAPIDAKRAVKRFLNHWRPDLALFVESELWPNLIGRTRAQGIPLALVNGRLSKRSFRGWRRWGWALGKPAAGFRLVLAQDETQAERFRLLGAPAVAAVGDLKAAAQDLPTDEMEVARFQTMIGARPVWLAASTHPGEEETVLTAHANLARRYPDLLTLLAPRHPNRAEAVAALVEAAGLVCRRRSNDDDATADAKIYLVDTMGEMGLFYRLAPIVLVAGSLGAPGRLGGHNPLEAARLGCALLHGPDMINCAAIAEALDRGGGAVEVQGETGLILTLDRLLREPERAAAMGRAAKRIAEEQAGVVDRIVEALQPVLAGLGQKPAAPAAQMVAP
jgi:3-deoxy-D-manno-octulosonic-acid transferase